MESLFKETEFNHTGVCGATGSGKSYLIYKKLLQDEKYFKYKYDRVYVFITTYETNKEYIDGLHLEDELKQKKKAQCMLALWNGDFDTYIHENYKMWVKDYCIKQAIMKENVLINEWYKDFLTEKQQEILMDDLLQIIEYDEDDMEAIRIYKHFDSDAVDDLFNKKLKYPDEKWLLIFDDCSYDKKFSSDKNLLKVLRNGRSRGLSSIILAQKLTDLPTTIRSQWNGCIFFFNTQPREVKALFENVAVSKNESEFKQNLFNLFDSAPKYSFLFIKMTHSSRSDRVFLNYEEKGLEL